MHSKCGIGGFLMSTSFLSNRIMDPTCQPQLCTTSKEWADMYHFYNLTRQTQPLRPICDSTHAGTRQDLPK